MDKYLSKDEFKVWEKDEYGKTKEIIIKLPCEQAAIRIENVYNKVDTLKVDVEDVDMKVDSIIGSHQEEKSKRARIDGMMYILVPFIIGVILYLIKNGG